MVLLTDDINGMCFLSILYSKAACKINGFTEFAVSIPVLCP